MNLNAPYISSESSSSSISLTKKKKVKRALHRKSSAYIYYHTVQPSITIRFPNASSYHIQKHSTMGAKHVINSDKNNDRIRHSKAIPSLLNIQNVLFYTN